MPCPSRKRRKSHLPLRPRPCLALEYLTLLPHFFSSSNSFLFTVKTLTKRFLILLHHLVRVLFSHFVFPLFSLLFLATFLPSSFPEFCSFHFYGLFPERFLGALPGCFLMVLGSFPELFVSGAPRSPPCRFSSKVLGSVPWLFLSSFGSSHKGSLIPLPCTILI